MFSESHIFRNLSVTLLSIFISVGCSKSFKSERGTAPSSVPSSTSQEVNPWSQGIPSPLSDSDPYASQPQPSGTYCALYIPSPILNRDQEFRIVVLSKDVVRVEVSVNNSSYVALGTNYGELKWPGNTFESGQYNLVFRGISSGGGIISCDPSSKQVTIQNGSSVPTPTPPTTTPPGTSPNPSPAPSPSPAPNPAPNPDPNNKRGDYAPLVRLGYSDYKTLYALDSQWIMRENGEIILTTAHANFSHSKIKIFVPPGAKRFYAKFQTYLSPTEAKAAVRFGEAPRADASNVNENTRFSDFEKTLDKLLLGNELVFHTPGGSGGLAVSQPSSSDNSNAVKGGYIYINLLSIPGGMIHGLQTRMVIDEACYRTWVANSKWDAQGNPDETAIHTCSGGRPGAP